jgi:hypothetical protein
LPLAASRIAMAARPGLPSSAADSTTAMRVPSALIASEP